MDGVRMRMLKRMKEASIARIGKPSGAKRTRWTGRQTVYTYACTSSPGGHRARASPNFMPRSRAQLQVIQAGIAADGSRGAPGALRAQSAEPAVAQRPEPGTEGSAAPGADAGLGSTQRIVDAITTAIVERRLMPGTKLAEQAIADLFQVSRTLVRQALNRLSRDHLVTLAPGRGAFVAQPGVDESRQVFEVRRMIEGQLVRQLCAQISPDQVAVLRQHLALESEAVARTDISGRTRMLADFHVVLARQLGNEVLAQLLADLLGRCSLIALMHQSDHSAEHSSAEHGAIVDAIERRDARAAVRLMESHLLHIERHLQRRPRLGRLQEMLMPA